MVKTVGDKTFEILYETEKVADEILSNKRALTELSKKKEDAREATRMLEKSTAEKTWITVGGGIMVKMKKQQAVLKVQSGKVYCTFVYISLY